MSTDNTNPMEAQPGTGEPQETVIEEVALPPVEIEIEEEGGEGRRVHKNKNNDDDSDDDDQREKKRAARRNRTERRRTARDTARETLERQNARIQELEQQIIQQSMRQQQLNAMAVGYQSQEIDRQLQQKENELAWYKEQYATAVNTADGTAAAQLLAHLQETERQKYDLLAKKQQFSQRQGGEDDLMQQQKLAAVKRNDHFAQTWFKANNDWFQQPGFEKETRLALSINNGMLQEGVYRPDTEEFWEELEERLAREPRLQHIYDEDTGTYTPSRGTTSGNVRATSSSRPTTGSSGGVSGASSGGKRVLKFESHLIPMLKQQGILDDSGKMIKGQEKRAQRYFDQIQQIRNEEKS